MGNRLDINNKQNQKENLMYLFGKQVYYDRASNLFFLSFIIALIALIIGAINVFVNDMITNEYSKYFSISITGLSIIGYVLNFFTVRFSNKGADYLDLFDNAVFGIKRVSTANKNELKSNLNELIKKDEDLFEARCSDEGDCGIKYKNWYEGVVDEKKDHMILKCQRQCLTWSRPIIIFALSIILFFTLVYICLIVVLFSKYQVKDFIWFLLVNFMNYINFGCYLYWIIKKLILCDSLKNDINDFLNTNKVNIAFIEKKLYKFRCIPTVSFRFYYHRVYRRKHIE